MRATQICLYCGSFAAVLLFGNVFDSAFFQAGLYVEALHGVKRLPPISEFLFENHELPPYLALLPWLALVGAPLLHSGRSYWEPQSFFLRYLAFLSCEILLFGVLALAVTIPYFPHYKVLENDHQATPSELTIRVVYWLTAALVVLLLVRRILQARRASFP